MLDIPCETAEELGLAAPALQQLRELRLNGPGGVEGLDGDGVMDVLLGLPHLTSLNWGVASCHTFWRWHNDRPCPWEQLRFGGVTPDLLARLPLHSPKQPVQWQGLMVKPRTSARDVRAAVANVTQRCPLGFRWVGSGEQSLPMVILGEANDAVLRALQPLLAPLNTVEVVGVEWDAERVKAVGEVLPRTCTRLGLSLGIVSREELEQVARSLPWLEVLELRQQQVAPEDVGAYVRLARRLKQEGGGEARLQEVVVERPVRLRGVGEVEHRQRCERTAREVCKVGGGTVALRMVW